MVTSSASDDGRGYALGFETRPLEAVHQQQSAGARYSFQVTYDDNLLRKVQHDFDRPRLSPLKFATD